MLLSLEITNYGVFKETALLDFTRRSLKTLQPTDGDWIKATHRAVGIWGANASGKSTILRALRQLWWVLFASIGSREALQSLHDPHLLSENDESEFNLEFESQGVRFRWSIAISSEGVTREAIDASDKSKWKKLIHRDGAKISFGSSSNIPQEARSFIRQASTQWVSAVQAWANSKNSGRYVHGPLYLRDRVYALHPLGTPPTETTLFVEGLVQKEKWRQAATQLLQYADLGISELRLEDKEVPLTPDRKALYVALLRNAGRDDIKVGETEKVKVVSLVHGDLENGFKLPLSKESDGTRTWLEMALPALVAVMHGDVLIIDEVDNSLHPRLVRRLISLFNDPELNEQGAQLLFTTHDSTLLGKYPTPAIEKGATWFTEKQRLESFLYSLDEFKVRENNNPEKQYLMGKYGAVPEQQILYLGQDLFDGQNELLTQIEP